MTTVKKILTPEERAKADKLDKPVMLIGTIPCYNQIVHSIWSFIKKPAEFMAKMSGGEYTVLDIFRAIWFGHSFLYVGYMCDSKEDLEFANKNVDNVNLIISKYVTMKKEKDFIGYTIVRLDDRGAHVWQAFVAEEYRGGDIFERCVEFIIERLVEIGVTDMTFSSMRRGWGDKIKTIGFKEGMTTFHRKIGPVEGEEDNSHIQV